MNLDEKSDVVYAYVVSEFNSEEGIAKDNIDKLFNKIPEDEKLSLIEGWYDEIIEDDTWSEVWAYEFGRYLSFSKNKIRLELEKYRDQTYTFEG